MRSHCASDLCPDSSVRKLPPAAVQKRSNARRQIDATSQRGQTDRRTPTQEPRNHSQLCTVSVARSLLLRIPLNCWRITRHRLRDLRAPTGVHQLTGQQCPPARCPEPRYRRLATRRGDRTAHRSAFATALRLRCAQKLDGKSARGLQMKVTRSSATAKSTARPSCLVGVLCDISWEKIC